MLPVRRLPAAGIDIPALGFGVSGPLATSLMSDAAVRNLLDTAWRGGVRVFDTGASYGAGRGERRLGAFLSSTGPQLAMTRPRQKNGKQTLIFVMTKVGTRKAGPGRLKKDFSPEGVRAQIRASLARLGRIDALWLHGPRPDELTPALFTACETEGAKAGVRLIGVCTRTPALIERVLAEPGPVGALMAPLALDPAEALPAWVDRAHDQGMGVFAIEALARAQRKSPWPPRRGADVWHLARAMKRRALGHLSPEASLAPETALQTVLSRPQVTCTLVTTTRPHHLHTNLAVAQRNS